MGNNYTVPQQSIINHVRFTRSQLVNFNQHILTEIGVSKGQAFKEWQQQLSALKQNHFINQQSLLIPQIYQKESSAFCGNDTIIRLLYPAYPYIFQDQIKNRRLTNNFFEQSQLWYLLFTLVCVACQHHQVFHTKVGDIRPVNIFFNQQGKIKIATKISWPQEKDNYQKVIMEHIQTYIAPQQVQSSTLKSNYLSSDKQFHKSQTFSIGLTMLHTILLQDMNKLYLPPGHFNKQFFESKLQKLKSLSYMRINQQNEKQYYTYSLELKQIILRLCQYDPQYRLDLIDLQQYLLPYQQNITQLKQFSPKSIPIRKSLYELNQKHPIKKIQKRQENYRPDVENYQQKQNLENPYNAARQFIIRKKKIPSTVQSPIKKFDFTKSHQQIQKPNDFRQQKQNPTYFQPKIQQNLIRKPESVQRTNNHVYFQNNPLKQIAREYNKISKQPYIQEYSNLKYNQHPKITSFNLRENSQQFHKAPSPPKIRNAENVSPVNIPQNQIYIQRKSLSIPKNNIKFTYISSDKNTQAETHKRQNIAYQPIQIVVSQKIDKRKYDSQRMTIHQLSRQSDKSKRQETPIKNLAGSSEYRNWVNNESSVKLLKKIDEQLQYSKGAYH